MLRTGARKLSLSDVATLAGVSRPTIYRYFVSKEDLIDALGNAERRRFNAAMDRAMSGVTGVARLEAAVDVVATSSRTQPPGRLLDLDPGFAHGTDGAGVTDAQPKAGGGVAAAALAKTRFAAAVEPRDLAGAIARTALSHYIFPDTDPAAARREIRATAGLSWREPAASSREARSHMSTGCMNSLSRP